MEDGFDLFFNSYVPPYMTDPFLLSIRRQVREDTRRNLLFTPTTRHLLSQVLTLYPYD